MTNKLDVTCPLLSATFTIDVESMAQKLSRSGVLVFEELLASSHALYMTVSVPVRKHGKFSKIAKAPRKRCQKTAIEAETGFAVSKYLLDTTEAAESTPLSSEALATQGALPQALKPVYGVKNQNFHNLLETHKH